jgi:hypothetical protein
VADEGEWGVHTDEVGMARIAMSGSTFDDAELSSSSGVCEGIVAQTLGRIKTRPGPDEEVVIQIIAHRRPIRSAPIRDIRRQG